MNIAKLKKKKKNVYLANASPPTCCCHLVYLTPSHIRITIPHLQLPHHDIRLPVLGGASACIAAGSLIMIAMDDWRRSGGGIDAVELTVAGMISRLQTGHRSAWCRSHGSMLSEHSRSQ